jgi:hypothetical protein
MIPFLASLFLASGVVISGQRWGHSPIHGFKKDWPPRIVVENTDVGWMTCEICSREFRLWMTDDAIWNLLPQDLNRSLLCTRCFRKNAKKAPWQMTSEEWAKAWDNAMTEAQKGFLVSGVQNRVIYNTDGTIFMAFTPRWVDVVSAAIKRRLPVPIPVAREFLLKTLDLRVANEEGVQFETGVPVTFGFVRNTEKSGYFGSQYQQNLEPGGRYMVHQENVDHLVPGWEKGTASFASPLVLGLNSAETGRYDEHSWKAALAGALGVTGRDLTTVLLGLGFDGIVTVERARRNGELETREIIDLKMGKTA